MRILGLDYGTKTLGVAISDESKMIATSLQTLVYTDEKKLIEDLKQVVSQYQLETIVLGLPKNMNNSLGERAEATIRFKSVLESVFDVPVILEDERLTSVIANSYLLQADVSRKKRKKVVDKMAASIILQSYLDRLGKER